MDEARTVKESRVVLAQHMGIADANLAGASTAVRS